MFIMMNNYFHDVATGLLMVSAAAIWLIMKKLDPSRNRETTEYFLRIYAGMTKLARIALIWILLGGVPRTIFYRSFEWANAVEHAQVPAIIVKHVLAFTFVALGVRMWIKFEKQVKEIRRALNAGNAS